MNVYVAELIGTALLVLMGNGVVSNVVLARTKGEGSGWIVITAGWGLAVFVAVACVGDFSGAHINPAVTFGLALAGEFDWAWVPGYIGCQMAGGFVGAVLIYIFYWQHYAATQDSQKKLAAFCTAPAISCPVSNLFCEVVGTFVLVFAVLLPADVTISPGDGGPASTVGLGALGAIPVGLVVLAIGLCLGGTTGYAINPARDFSPRIAHALLPIPGKGDSQWSYGWIPVIGPLLGGAAAALLYLATLPAA